MLKTPLKNFTYDFAVNAGGPLHLLQAIYSLLQKSSLEGGAVWAPISSCLGSIAESPNMPALAYGASKAALNYTSKRLAVEHPELKVLIIQYVACPYSNFWERRTMGFLRQLSDAAATLKQQPRRRAHRDGPRRRCQSWLCRDPWYNLGRRVC